MTMRWVPLIGTLRTYRRTDLRYDVIAGITVSALVVPKALGYADIARVPIERGLYAAAAGALLYALFGTSRQISTGPSSAMAAIAASAVALTGVTPGDETNELVAAITITTGALFLIAAAARLGWLSRLLSRAVITGFLFGAAIDVVAGELPKLTGTDADGANTWHQFASWLANVGDLHGLTLVVGAVSLGVVMTLHVVAPKVPGALVLVVGGLAASWLLDLHSHGVATVGTVPRGLPAAELPSGRVLTQHAGTILTAAIALFLVGFSQTAGDARVFAHRHGYRIGIDHEMVAQGASNAGAGLFQGMPVSTSLSASSLNDASGARTAVASIVTAAVVLLTLIVLAPLFSDLPKPVLAAIIIDAVAFGMMDIAEMRRLWRVKRADFWIAVMAVFGVLAAGVLAGVVIGIALSIAWLVYVSATPAIVELGHVPGTTAWAPIAENADAVALPGRLVVRIHGGLTFITAEAVRNAIEEQLDGAAVPVTIVVVDFAGVNFVDSEGVAHVRELAELARRDGWSLRLVRVNPEVALAMEADDLPALLGMNRLHANIDDAVATEHKAGRDGPAATDPDR